MKINWSKILDDFNIKKQADELGVSIWQAPSFLFMLMGLIIMIAMTAVYGVSRIYDSPELVVLSETLVVTILFTIGNVIIKSVEEMARANKMKSEFVSVASHQLKTPLSEMSWELELLLAKHQIGLNEKQLELINRLSVSASRMTKLVGDLLDVARIEQGKFVLLKEEFDLEEVIREAIKDDQVYARACGVEIEFKTRGRVPAVVGDKRKIGVVVDNLVSNAVKYIEKRGNVEIILTADKKSVAVSIKDNGVGIPKSQQEKIFQKFFRSDNVVKYQTEGTGLGLYIAKNIIEQSGGKIWFRSAEGEGTTFSFSLPIKNNL